MNDMLKIVCVFLARPESAPFREPVNWKALGLVDYPKVVKKPMDLGTIKRKIENGEYTSAGTSTSSTGAGADASGDDSNNSNSNGSSDSKSGDTLDPIEACAADIRLVWTNCMMYNQDGSDFYHLALLFAKKFDEVYAQLRKSSSKGSSGSALSSLQGVDMNRIPTLEERMSLSYDIFCLSNLEMGRVITAIEAGAPAALSFKPGAADEVIVNFDVLPPRTFHEVAAMVMGFVANRKNTAKAAAATAAASTSGGKKKRGLEESSAAGTDGGGAGKHHRADSKK